MNISMKSYQTNNLKELEAVLVINGTSLNVSAKTDCIDSIRRWKWCKVPMQIGQRNITSRIARMLNCNEHDLLLSVTKFMLRHFA